MAATVYKDPREPQLIASGETKEFVWEDVPEGLAYAVDVDPFYPTSDNETANETTEAEVIRVRRRTRVIEKLRMRGGADFEVHHDILGTVKNVGDHVLYFDLYLTVFS